VLSLPFASFCIPGWQAVLTHSSPTGFNCRGACVPFGLTAQAPRPASPPGLRRLASAAAGLVSVAERGRQARGGQAYQLGDLGRGLWHKLLGGGGGGAFLSLVRHISQGLSCMFRADAGLESPAEALELPLAVASVHLVREATEQHEDVTFFCVEAVADGSLDADGGGEPWRVMRRYSDFRQLGRRLGPRSWRYPDAPFPRRHVGPCTDAVLEARHCALEVWLQRVVQDPWSQGAWAGCLHDFLLDGLEQAEDGAEDESTPRRKPAATAAAAWAEMPDPGAMVPTLLGMGWEPPHGTKPEPPAVRATSPAPGPADPGDEVCADTASPCASSEAGEDLFHGLTLARKATADAQTPTGDLRQGLWSMFQSGLAKQAYDGLLGLLEEPAGNPAHMREPLLWAVAPDPGAMIPAMPSEALLALGSQPASPPSPR